MMNARQAASAVIALGLALSCLPAMAAHMASASVGYYGVYYPVIGGGAIFTLTVKNNASSANAINKVVLDFQTSGFKVVWANGAGWSAGNTETTCTFQTPPGTNIAPGIAKEFSTKVTLPWTIAQYDFAVTTYDTAAASASFRTGNKVNVSFGSCGNADAVDLLHANATPTANMLLPLGGDAKFDGAVLRDATISGVKLMNGAVTSDKLAFFSVGTSQLTNSAVSTAQLADASVTEPKIADGAVATAKIADAAVTTAKLAAGAVTADTMASASVTTDKLADHSVTDAKIEGMWRFVDLPILSSRLEYGAQISTSMGRACVDLPQPAPGNFPEFILMARMPNDWDSVANPSPYVEVLWFADDTVANRGKTVRFCLGYERQPAGQAYNDSYAPACAHFSSDASNAAVIETTGSTLAMGNPFGMPQAPGDPVWSIVYRPTVATGVELPDTVHVMSATLWYQAKR